MQKVIRGRITRKKISNEIGQLETQIAGIENQVHKAAERLKTKEPHPQSTPDVLNKNIARSIIGKSIIRKAAAAKSQTNKNRRRNKTIKTP